MEEKKKKSAIYVSPRRGEWVEISSFSLSPMNGTSPLAEGSGLKCIAGKIMSMISVSPRRGEWVEMFALFFMSSSFSVSPRRGEWVEIDKMRRAHRADSSLPSQRGVG